MRYTTRTGLAVVVTLGFLSASPTARAQRMMPRMTPVMPAGRMTPMMMPMMTPNQMMPMMTPVMPAGRMAPMMMPMMAPNQMMPMMTPNQMTPMMTAQQAALDQAAFRTFPGFNPNGVGNPFAGTNPFPGGNFNPYSGTFANTYGSGVWASLSGNRGYGSGAGYGGSGSAGGSGGAYGGSGGYGNSNGSGGTGSSGGYSGSGGYGDPSGSGGYSSDPASDYRTGATGAANTGAPTAEDRRLRQLQVALDRARSDPSLTEIASGRPLNVLLASLSDQLANGRRGRDVALNDELLSRINVAATPEGDIGLLRDEGKLKWPESLQATAFAEIRLQMNGLIAEAVRLARSGKPVTPGILEELAADLQLLKDTVRDHIGEMTPSEYVESLRYLSGLGECVKALSDPNVSNYFNKAWSARGRTVADLVPNMAGLYFAPAAPGDEVAYRVLHQALVTFDARLTAADAK
jgi:hypothetical protein